MNRNTCHSSPACSRWRPPPSRKTSISGSPRSATGLQVGRRRSRLRRQSPWARFGLRAPRADQSGARSWTTPARWKGRKSRRPARRRASQSTSCSRPIFSRSSSSTTEVDVLIPAQPVEGQGTAQGDRRSHQAPAEARLFTTAFRRGRGSSVNTSTTKMSTASSSSPTASPTWAPVPRGELAEMARDMREQGASVTTVGPW